MVNWIKQKLLLWILRWSFEDAPEYIKQKLQNHFTAHLFCMPNKKDVLSVDHGIIKLGGEQLSNTEILQLKSEILVLQDLRLWKLLQEKLRYEAMEVAFTRSMNFDDVKSAKLMLVNLDIMQSLVNVIKNHKVVV